jgi:hypothetical protein
MGRYMQVSHRNFLFRILYRQLSIQTIFIYLFPFFWRCILVSLLRSILGLLNFHFGKWVYLAMLSIAQTFQSNFNAFELFIIQCCTTIVIHCYLKTSAFISYYKTCSNSWPSWFIHASKRRLSFFLHPMPFSITSISKQVCMPLKCFHKRCIQSNQHQALSKLMHSIHCNSAVFTCQASERRPAQHF